MSGLWYWKDADKSRLSLESFEWNLGQRVDREPAPEESIPEDMPECDWCGERTLPEFMTFADGPNVCDECREHH